MFDDDSEFGSYSQHRYGHVHEDADTQLRYLRVTEWLLVACVALACLCFLWGGLRAWSAGGGVTAPIVALVATGALIWALPRMKHHVFKYVTDTNGDLDAEWQHISANPDANGNH